MITMKPLIFLLISCSFVSGLQLSAQVDCSRAADRYQCNPLGLVTVTTPKSLQFQFSTQKELVIVAYPPAENLFRLNPENQFALNVEVKLWTAACNVSQVYTYQTNSRGHVRFIDSTRHVIANDCSGQLTYVEGKSTLGTSMGYGEFEAKATAIVVEQPAFLCQAIEITIPIVPQPASTCQSEQWNGDTEQFLSTVTTNFYITGFNRPVLDYVPTNFTIDKNGVPQVPSSVGDLTIIDLINSAEEEKEGNKETEAKDEEKPEDPLLTWLSTAPGISPLEYLNVLSGVIAIVILL